MENVKITIQDVLNSRGLTQGELADILGVSDGVISRIKRGRDYPITPNIQSKFQQAFPGCELVASLGWREKYTRVSAELEQAYNEINKLTAQLNAANAKLKLINEVLNSEYKIL